MKNQKRWSILNRAFLSSVLTVSLIELSQVGDCLIDGIITSRMLGTNSIAAVGLGHPIFSIAGIVGGVLSVGMQTFCSEKIGRGNFKAFSKIVSVVLAVAAALSLALSTVIILFANPISAFFGARGNSADLLKPAADYIKGLAIGCPAMITVPVLAFAVQLDNNSKLVRIGAITNSIVDICLDYIAIKTNTGVFGIGLASSLSLYSNFAILSFHFLKKDRILKLRFSFSDLPYIKTVFKEGNVTAIRRIANVLRPILINNLIIIFGCNAAMVVMGVRNSIIGFSEILGSGIYQTVPMLVGIVYGERSTDDFRHTGRMIHRAILLGVGSISILMAALSPLIARLYIGNDKELFSMVCFSICMLAAESVAEALINSRITFLNAISKEHDGQLLQFADRLLIVVAVVMIMGKLFGVYGILASFLISNIILLGIVYAVNVFRTKKFRLTLDDYLYIDSSFEVDPIDSIELDIRDYSDCSLVSHQVHLFCEGHQVESRKAYFSALALEETIRIMFERNEKHGKHAELNMDVRVTIKDGDTVIRIRDNSDSIYPFGEVGTADETDPFANIGVRMVRKIAKDIKYYNTLKINYTIITV